MTQKYRAHTGYSYNNTTYIEPGDILIVANNGKVYNTAKHLDFKLSVSDLEQLADLLYDENITVTSDIDFLEREKTNIEEFRDITEKMLDIFIRKNHDYGNSFEQSLDEEGLAASRIRMGDKWNRFKELSKGKEILVNDESIKDTLLDIANYAIMTVMWLNK